MRTEPRSLSRGQRGFSIVELAVSLFIAAQILIAAAIAFDVHNKVARAQTQIADLQQSLRVAQYDMVRLVRSAGRGGIPMDLDPSRIFDASTTIPAYKSLAVEVRNNVTGDDEQVARGLAGTPLAVEGTDILTVRGCLSGSVFQIDPSTIDWDYDASGNPDASGTGITLTIPRTSVAGLLQQLGGLVDEIQAYGAAAIKGRLALVSPESLQNYGVGNITSLAVSGGDDDPDSISVILDFDTDSTLNPIDAASGARAFPTFMSASLVCMLEEYRYYVRALPGDAIVAKRPRLTRARFEPGTETPYLNDDSNLTVDIADGVFDLQVALGLDTDYTVAGYDATVPGCFIDDTDNIGDDDVIFEADQTDPSQNATQDDWLYNAPGDVATDARYTTHTFNDGDTDNTSVPVQTYFVRITTVARTSRPDPGYGAPAIDTRTDGEWVEDHNLASDASKEWITGDALRHRRRLLTTIVEMRNI